MGACLLISLLLLFGSHNDDVKLWTRIIAALVRNSAADAAAVDVVLCLQASAWVSRKWCFSL